MIDPNFKIKPHLHARCLMQLQLSIDTLERAMADVQAAANEETKSSAWDKYETGRAVMQAGAEVWFQGRKIVVQGVC